MPTRKRLTKTKGAADEQRTTRTKPDWVTQSARFTPEQMKEIDQACKTRDCSVAQLILVATIEKAVAINELEAKRQAIHRSIVNLIESLQGRLPQITINGKKLPDPERDWGEEWGPDGFGAMFSIGIGDDVNSAQAETQTESTDEKLKIGRVGYNPDERTVTLHPSCSTDDPPIASLSPCSLDDGEIEQLIACFRVLCPELGDMVKEAYSDIRLRRRFYATKFRTADSLLHPERKGSPDWYETWLSMREKQFGPRFAFGQ